MNFFFVMIFSSLFKMRTKAKIRNFKRIFFVSKIEIYNYFESMSEFKKKNMKNRSGMFGGSYA